MEPVARNIASSDVLTILLFASLLLLAITRVFYAVRFNSFLALPVNNKYISLYSKKDKLFNGFNLLTAIFQILNISIFLILSSDSINLMTLPIQLPIAFKIALIILVFLVVKIIMQFFMGFVFDTMEMVEDIIYNKQSYFNVTGLLFCLANIFLLYIVPGSKAVIYITIALFLLINFIGLVNVLRMHQNTVAKNIFYFILYLCALEIAPLVIVGSYLKA